MKLVQSATSLFAIQSALSNFSEQSIQLGFPLKYRNLYTDTGLLYFDSASEFYKRLFNDDIPITLIDRSLRHQIMFASGNPRFEQIRMANAIKEIGLRESTLELIQGKNAIEFLGGTL